MRRLAAFTALAFVVLAILWSCSKKSSPTAPPPPGPACALSTTALVFDTVTVGSSADRTFTLTNTGGGTLAGSLSETCGDFAIVGTQSYSLTAGQSATFTLRFTPQSAGNQSCAVGTGSTCGTVTCTGTGKLAPGAQCAISPSALDFGAVEVGGLASRTFTISNTGGDTLKGAVSESCPDVRIRGGAAYAVPPGQSATVTVDFVPAAAGPMSCSINPGTGCASVSCAGVGTGGQSAACQVSPTSLDFGSVPVGAGVTCKSFTVTNVSTDQVISGAPSIRCPCVDWVWAAGSGGSYYLNPGESATYTLCFKPTSSGPKEVTVVIPERDEFCSSVSCTGLGVEPPPDCELTVGGLPGATLDLGTLAVGQERYYPSAVDFGLRNRGGGRLTGTVSSACPSIGVHNPVSGSLSYDLGQNEQAYFGVRFAPTAPGPQNCTLETGNPDCANLRVLANAVTSASPCWVETPTLDFGIVQPGLGRTLLRHLRITNVFAGGLSGQIFEPCGDFAFDGPSTAYSLAAGQSVQWGVVFTPGGTAVGTRTCTLNLDQTGTSECAIVQCTATVKFTAGSATPLTLAFPATRIGESHDLTLTITAQSAVSGTVTVPCSEFAVIGSPTYSLAAGGQASFTIRYTPTAVGLHQCTISTGTDCESVWVYGTGYVP